MPKEVDWTKLAEYEKTDMTIASQELACVAGGCEIWCMKLIVCDSCEAEYQIKHNLNERYYVIQYCIFCGEILSDELEDEIEWNEDDY